MDISFSKFSFYDIDQLMLVPTLSLSKTHPAMVKEPNDCVFYKCPGGRVFFI